MCTLTIIPIGKRYFRLMTNRDELHTRPLAQPPMLHGLSGGLEAVWPRDPVGGGTWVAASSRGLVLALLNVNPPPQFAPAKAVKPTSGGYACGVEDGAHGREAPDVADAGTISRGRIIPRLIDSRQAEQAIDRLGGMDLDNFAPFRLIAAERGGIFWLRWDGQTAERGEAGMAPMCFSSSGLGDDLVEQCRNDLFVEMIVHGRCSAAQQDAFHEHRWEDRPEVSVRMERKEARTVSVTTVLMRRLGDVAMRYRAKSGETEVRLSPAAAKAAAAAMAPSGGGWM